MFSLCLFDLDQTLLRTDDLKEVREAGKGRSDTGYLAQLSQAYAKETNRHVYDLGALRTLRTMFPEMKIGVFTRSPKAYAQAMLAWSYPDFQWDILVAYEDVHRTKPFGDGIDLAMRSFGIEQLDQVVLVGDGDNDLRAAYHAGCIAILDRSAWPDFWQYDQWNALGHIADAIICSPVELPGVLTRLNGYLPELERALTGEAPAHGRGRYDKINHFIPRLVGGDNTPFPIFSAGRFFPRHESLQWRRNWHLLTESILSHKDADTFPDEWIQTVKNFIEQQFMTLGFAGSAVITVVPHRPGRPARLEAFLAQLEATFEGRAFNRENALAFVPDLLAYRPGVRSNSNEHLSGQERFINVRDNLYVQKAEAVANADYVLVIDDVCTTGSTLIYSKKHLDQVGARGVTCLSLAKNISNVV
jgi:beta-phosphoglucomutase-like phosphatase (HAD superfamily)